MLRLRLTTEAQARWKNGQPAHSTTGVASTNCSQVDRRGDTRSCRPSAGMCPPISRTNTGRASARPIQKRRVMSISSRFGPASAVTSSGSSAMPQIGQLPGPVLPDLRMHRAGVDRALRLLAGRAVSAWLQIAAGVGDELLAAAGRAEVERRVRRCLAVVGDLHAAAGSIAHAAAGSGTVASSAVAVRRGRRHGGASAPIGRTRRHGVTSAGALPAAIYPSVGIVYQGHHAAHA